jgi:hypothetical protein
MFGSCQEYHRMGVLCIEASSWGRTTVGYVSSWFLSACLAVLLAKGPLPDSTPAVSCLCPGNNVSVDSTGPEAKFLHL